MPGTTVIRAIRADDAAGIERFFARLTPDDVRARFFQALRALPPGYVEQLTHPDAAHGAALVAVDGEDILGVGRLIDGELAVTVRSDLKHRGIGLALLERLLDVARRRGTGEVCADILAANRACLGMARKLGFALHRALRRAGLVRAKLRL